MIKVIIHAPEFTQRQDLDDFIKSKLGDNASANSNAGHMIEGTIEELTALSLGADSRVYGVEVVVNDEK